MEIKAKIQLLLLKRRVFHTFSLSISNIYNGRSFRPKHTTPLPYGAAGSCVIMAVIGAALYGSGVVCFGRKDLPL